MTEPDPNFSSDQGEKATSAAGPAPTEATSPPTPSGGHPGKVVERPHPLTPLLRSWIVLVALATIAIQEVARNLGRNDSGHSLRPGWWIAWVVLGGVIVSGLFGLVTWLTTRFVADDDELRIDTGWLVKQSKRISYSRIQSVDVVQPLAARIFALAEVRIDAGGGPATKIQFLGRNRAYQLRDYLMHRAHRHVVSVEESNAASDADAFFDVGSRDRLLVRVTPLQLIVGALLSHELVFIVIGFLVPGLVVMGISAAFGHLDPADLLRVWTLALASLGIPMVFAVGGFLSRRVIGQFNYSLAETPAGLRIARGLTNLTSQTVPANRIQSMRVAQPILWRLIGRFRVDLEVLGYGEQTRNENSSNTSTILLPIGTAEQVAIALHAVWPGVDITRIPVHGTPKRSHWLDPLTYRWLGFGSDERVVITRTGWLTRVQGIVPHARLQSARITQGPLERRLDVANLELHTTGLLRTHAAIHIDGASARKFLFAEADRARTARASELMGPALG